MFGVSKFSSGIKGAYGNVTGGEKDHQDHGTFSTEKHIQRNCSEKVILRWQRRTLKKERHYSKRRPNENKSKIRKEIKVISAMMVCARNMRYEIKTRYEIIKDKCE